MSVMLVYVTAKNRDEALQIARTVVKESLAACANVLGEMTSVYSWEGQLHEDQEVNLILKTTSDRFEVLKARVEQLHSYSTPCILGWSIDAGNDSYVKWLVDQLS